MDGARESSRNLLIGVVFGAIIGLIVYAAYLTQPDRPSSVTAGHDAGMAAPALTGEKR